MKNKHVEPYRHRYKIEKCTKTGAYKVVDPQSGNEIYPSCGEDAAGLHAYWLGKGKPDVADDLLGDILSGLKPVTRLRQSIEELRGVAA